MKTEKIYFDMDDTIADFSLGLKEICGLEPVDQSLASKKQDNDMWNAIKESGDFYYRLKELEGGMNILKELRKKYDSSVEILSAVPKEKRGIKTAESDKRRWVEEHIGRNISVKIVRSASEKRLYAAENIMLVDDLKKNIDEWKEAGGIGILFDRNNPQKTYDEIMDYIRNFNDLNTYREYVMECLIKQVGKERALKLMKSYECELEDFLKDEWSPSGAATAMVHGY